MSTGPRYDRIIGKGDRVRLTNEAGSATGTVVRVSLMNTVIVVDDATGEEFRINRSKLTKVIS